MKKKVFIFIWMLQTYLTRIAGWVASTIRPITDREQVISSWPPVKPTLLWLERVWIAPLERWDAVHYILILTQGYRAGDGTLQFHPLYPLFALLLKFLGITPLTSLFLVSTIGSLVSYWCFYMLAQLDTDDNAAWNSVLLLFSSPFAFAFFIPYSESLFVFTAILSLFFARLRRWWVAGLFAALATLTRQQGILLVLPLLWEFFESSGNNQIFPSNYIHFKKNLKKQNQSNKGKKKLITNIGAICLAPAAYVGWICFRAIFINDVTFDNTNFNSIVYSFLISPDAVKVVPIQSFMFPWKALWLAIGKLIESPDADIVTNLVWGLYYLVLLVLSWRYMHVSYRIYCLATTLISFSYHTGPLHPYMGLVRHLLLGFPVFIGLARKMRKPAQRFVLISINLIGFFQLIISYTLHIWVP
ncbi:MAG: glycosyltransferase family 39 protein [Bacteroidales bacterium]|nr:glycosyltransferase family 39 protein [Bacteroidales bacterium]